MSFAAKHRIEYDGQLTHAGDKCRFGMLAAGAQPQVEGSDGQIAADSCDRRQVQDAPDLGASAPYETAAAHAAAISIERRQASQRGDLLAIESSQLRQVGEQGSRQHCADTRHRTQQLVTFSPQRGITNQGAEFVIEATEALFQQRTCSSILRYKTPRGS
jgi:hypothetical protein